MLIFRNRSLFHKQVEETRWLTFYWAVNESRIYVDVVNSQLFGSSSRHNITFSLRIISNIRCCVMSRHGIVRNHSLRLWPIHWSDDKKWSSLHENFQQLHQMRVVIRFTQIFTWTAFENQLQVTMEQLLTFFVISSIAESQIHNSIKIIE